MGQENALSSDIVTPEPRGGQDPAPPETPDGAWAAEPADASAEARPAPAPPEEAPFDRVIRMRITLAVGLLLPLLFFIFLVVRFQEAWWLAVVGAGVYLYILGQFFVFRNPRLMARRPGDGAEEPAAEGTADGPADGSGAGRS